MAHAKHHKGFDIFELANRLEDRLREKGVPFNQHNLPDFRCFDFPKFVPSDLEMLPLAKRHRAFDPSRTLLCAFENDRALYNHLRNLDLLINEIKRRYWGCCGFDLSVCIDGDPSEQWAYLYVNMLITGYMLVRGVRVIPNWRTGSTPTLVALESYPRDICFAAGTLGCAQRHVPGGIVHAVQKILITDPSSVVIYGPLRKEYESVLNDWHIPYLVKKDYRRDSYDGKYRNRKAA